MGEFDAGDTDGGVRRDVRASESPFVERITRVVYEKPVDELSTPDVCWDLVIVNGPSGTAVFQTGLTSRPVRVRAHPGESFLSIAFKPGVFMPRLPALRMRDSFRVHPLASSRAFSLEGERLEIPNFENAEGLIERLVRRELLARDEVVESHARGRPFALSERSVQRHFHLALGMTPKQLSQIQRARAAVDRLERGGAIAAVAAELGYSDQAHMTRSLKAIMGRTPGEIVRARRP
jgi:AraC-like DNA-binding protein